MATYTSNYNLEKPDATDPIDISVLNDNFDEIDTQMKANADAAAGVLASGSISLTASWTDNSGTYSQEVSITGATENSKIDLQPDASVIAQLISDGVRAMWAENDSGTITVYTIGAAPSVALTIQYTRMEVSA